MTFSRKDIFDALTCDSSMDGCDGDWRAGVLANANPEDIKFVRREIVRHPSSLEKEIETDLRRQKKI